jgi:hypothetical protein
MSHVDFSELSRMLAEPDVKIHAIGWDCAARRFMIAWERVAMEPVLYDGDDS